VWLSVSVGAIAIGCAVAEEASTRKPPPVEPFTVELEVLRQPLPEPMTVLIEATRSALPAPFTVIIEARRPRLPEPLTVSIEGRRRDLPEPIAVTLEALRSATPDPYTVVLEATRPDACDEVARDLAGVASLADRGSFRVAQEKLDAIPDGRCPKLVPKIAAERGRMVGLVDDAARVAEAALVACRFEESRTLIGALPDGSRRAALVERWNTNYAAEDQARQLARQAIALRDRGAPIEALTLLREGRAVAVCADSPDAIDKAIVDVESLIAETAEATLDRCEFQKSRDLIAALAQGPSRSDLAARWNDAYEAERRTREMVGEAVALRDRGERGRAIGVLHEARDLTTCGTTVTAIDKAIIALGDGDGRPSEDEAATADCRRRYGAGYRAGDSLGDGRRHCIPDQVTANARCDQINGSPGHEAFDIRNDGTFSCRMGEIAAADWCRKQRGAGWYPVFDEDRRRVTCHPNSEARDAQCVIQFGAGWRAGAVRRDGRWTCRGPKQQVTTPRPQPGAACPPGHIPTKSGGCLNIGGVMQGLRDPVRGLVNP
jgi:hypothetical protein